MEGCMKHLSTLVAVLCTAALIIAAPTDDTQKKPASAKEPAKVKTEATKETKAAARKPAAAKISAPVKTVAKKEPKAEDKGVAKFMGGTIVGVDAAKKTITVRLKSNNYPVSIVPKTELVAKHNKISFADLKKGDYVTINYLKFKNGERKAEKINNKTFAVKLSKMESKTEPKAKPAQAKRAKAQVKAQPAPTQKKAVQANPKPEAKTIQKEEAKPEEKKETTKAAK
jgi:hypothetical protein